MCRVLYVGGVWVNSQSYADDMVLLAPTVTALQTLLEVCRAYAEPHDIVYNTMKTVCMLIRPKQSQGQYSTRISLGNEDLSFVEEFRYLGHVMTADLSLLLLLLKKARSAQLRESDVHPISTKTPAPQYHL